MPRGAAVIRYDGKRGVVWRIKYRDASNRQHMETLGRETDGWTEALAHAELRDRLVRIDKQRWRRPRPLTFAEYADEWLELHEARGDVKLSTLRNYRVCVNHLKDAFGSQRLGDIKARDVNRYVADKSKTHQAGTLRNHVIILGIIYKRAIAEELVDRNPTIGSDRVKVTRRKWRILEPAEIAAVDQAFDDDLYRLMFRMLVVLGLRRHELHALRWRDVNFTEGYVRVAQSKSAAGVRALAMPAMIRETLERHYAASAFQANDDLVVCHPHLGTPIKEHRFADAFKAAREKAGIEGYMRPYHDLRHTSITHDAMAGANPAELMARAGHSSMEVTKIYLHLADRPEARQAALLEERLFGIRDR